MRKRLGLLVLTAALAITGHARADGHADALAAFERGRILRDQAKFAEAAKEFKESVDKERSVGGFYNLGLCLDKLGKYPDALKAYRQSVAIAQEKGDPRAKEALDAVQAVRSRTHWVIVNVRDDVMQTPGLRIELDAKVVRAEDHGVEQFNDSAEHTLKVAAKDHEDLVVHPPDRQPFTVERLGRSLVVAHEETAPAPPPPEARAWGWEKWTAIPLFIGGAIGIGYGIHYSIDWSDRKSELQGPYSAAGCPNSTPACKDLDTKFNQAKDDAIRENAVSYSIGGVLLLGGVFLFVLSPGAVAKPLGGVRVVPSLGVGQTGMTVLGAF